MSDDIMQYLIGIIERVNKLYKEVSAILRKVGITGTFTERDEQFVGNIDRVLDQIEPRVLTLEEVMQYIGYSEKIPPKEWEKLPLWTESRNGTGVISGYRDVENLCGLIDMDGMDGTYIAYKHWRCWTAKPTKEQMEAVPWNT